jgi:hypothetical protein
MIAMNSQDMCRNICYLSNGLNNFPAQRTLVEPHHITAYSDSIMNHRCDAAIIRPLGKMPDAMSPEFSVIGRCLPRVSMC